MIKFPKSSRKKSSCKIFSSEAGLICAYDNKGVLTNETVTNIIIENDRRAKYILGLLNSKLGNYFLIFGSYNCSKMTMHTDKEYVGSNSDYFS
ncbi:hypothetical protein KHA80_08055 [Anaerobacillus sp. HL2]|nr:hypothetical protein KHA80_08055 [Anaerobacillus sp. HL2]